MDLIIDFFNLLNTWNIYIQIDLNQWDIKIFNTFGLNYFFWMNDKTKPKRAKESKRQKKYKNTILRSSRKLYIIIIIKISLRFLLVDIQISHAKE